ncbi:MAG: VPLPA-CTERM-specific exosortase XrtD [Syntrophaceae bacterium]|nr:VPLPA-CTERM-specific exosortase XrtD [Syntrophaceae bacterium]
MAFNPGALKSSAKTATLLHIAVYALLLAGLFHSAYRVMFSWWAGEDFNYCYLIPLIVLYLVWDKRDALAGAPARPSWWGLAPVVLGIALFWLGELGGEFYTLYLASWLIFAGLLWAHLGWAKLKIIWFPVVFLLAMFPPPNIVNFPLSLKLRLISSQLGVAFLHLAGMSAYREGNVIDLGFTQLQVVDACSGLRYLYPLIVMAILLAYFYRAAIWKKVVLVLSVLPLTIFMNSLRIAATGILYRSMGAAAAEGFFHGFSGWLVYMFALACLLLEMYVLNKLPGSAPARRDADEKAPVRMDAPARARAASRIAQPQFMAVAGLLTLTLVASQGIEFRERIPIAKPFSQFPMQVAGWTGKTDTIPAKFREGLYFSDYLLADYVDGQGKRINLYVAYYESQRKAESIHSPETCLPGSGWEFKNAGRKTIAVGDGHGRSMRLMAATMENAGQKQIVYYWFAQRGRVNTSLPEVKLYNFWDALTRQRTDGALVRLITPVLPGETPEEAEKRLQEFTREVVPTLEQFLPK